ncbi:HEAT repeat domain-containing protein, partial [bacterium]|nr:HEAT repeat domain-containing protein [candidate division CSSED10-310 bacterium]
VFQTFLADTDPVVRGLATRALGRMGITDAETERRLVELAQSDSDPANRQAALRALGTIQPEAYRELFRQALNDPALPVHLEGKRWIERMQDHQAVGLLQNLTTSPTHLIRLSAAETLIKLGDKSGFPVMIDTLETFPRRRSPYDTSMDVAAFLAEYSGQQLGWDADAWRSWWITAESGFDLRTTIDARIDYLHLIADTPAATPGQLLHAIDRLRKKHAEYRGLDRQLAPWVRVKAAEALAGKAVGTAVTLGHYATAMNPGDPECWSILSECLYANNDFSGANTAIVRALDIDSKNAHYRRLREIYKKAMSGPES